ncbi:DEP domain-containing protein 4 isoform X1 [Triplophysa rosa]|uniref:DEP domain-containing protein 7 n=2 Tax=Triplophysa rosa TaxID=992332 RepID=A0A9W7T5K4_TRIRA|nr:DEP domain-containing protein 4 isoform X1 [Triplophysa rosa]KAI7792013.1 putative DEP domain-containing protein 7 [Triplophysa rosa]
MAVDLTPRFRRLNSQTCFSENKQLSGVSGPFKATQLWQNIIEALQTQVERRPRRQHLRIHHDCFTGSDAVDVVLSHLMQNIYFCSSEVSRLKAAKLCQALMDSRVFEPVGMKLFRKEKEMTFEDSSCSLYRFLDSGDPYRKRYNENQTPDQHTGKKTTSKFGEKQTISNPFVLGSSDRRVERLLKNINLHPSVPSDLNRAAFSNGFLSKKVVREVWKQQALHQLLQVVEIPMLDCILTSPAKPEALWSSLRNHSDLVISNTCVDREVSKSLNLPELDSWLIAAVDCLELFPDQLIVVVSEQLFQQNTAAEEDKLGAHKKLLFDTIAKYYNSPDRPPLVSGRYTDIQAGILHLIGCGRSEDSLRASQLFLHLVEPTSRDELRRLLGFMAAAADNEAFRLHKQIENRALVSRMFAKAVIQNKEMTRVQCEQLLLFFMDHYKQLFKTPSSLIKAVTDTLQSLQQGRDLDNVALFTFCQLVSLRQYEDNRDKDTLASLKQLMHHISQSDSLSVKQKRRLAKQFQKHHPGVFLEHFFSSF